MRKNEKSGVAVKVAGRAMREEFRKEVARKTVHFFGGLAVAIICFLIPDWLYIPFSACFAVFIAFLFYLECLRFHGCLSLPMLRSDEHKNIGGHVFFFLGAFICVLIFPKSIAVASILMLSAGDAASGVAFAAISEQKSNNPPHKKPFLVMFVMFIVSFTAGYIFFRLIHHPFPVIFALSGSVGATIAESFPIRIFNYRINDNITIPLLAGSLMLLLRFAFF